MGVACATAGGGTLSLLRDGFSIRLKSVLPELRKSWLLGRWIAATRVAALVQTYAVYWLLAAALGTAATGVYTASMTLLLAANPFVIGIGNLLEPQAALAMAEGGVIQLRLVVWKATQLLGSVMGIFCGLLFVFGGWLVAALYSGNQYENPRADRGRSCFGGPDQCMGNGRNSWIASPRTTGLELQSKSALALYYTCASFPFDSSVWNSWGSPCRDVRGRRRSYGTMDRIYSIEQGHAGKRRGRSLAFCATNRPI